MKNRRILLESNSSAKAFPAPSAGSRSVTASPPNTGISPPAAAGLLHNKTAAATSSSPPSDDDAYDFNARFNPSMAIIIVVLLSAFFFMGFFSIYVRRCTNEDDNERTSRRGRAAGNGNARADRASQGLDREIIDSFPIFSYSLVKGLKKGKESLECAVCLSEFEEDESLRMLPKCNHTFHPDCIDMWLQSHTTCPVCRTSLVPGDGSRRDQAIGSGSEDAETGSANGNQLGVVERGSISLNGECSSRRSHDSPILGLINSVGSLTRHKIRRSNSTGHSLVRSAFGGSNSKAEQSINLGQSPGIHRSSSCVIFSPSSQEASNCAGPSNRVRGSESTRALDEENRNVDPRIIRSERWGFSMNPPFFLRTYSERMPPYSRDELAPARSQLSKPVQQDGNVYMQSLRRSIKWLTGRDPGAGSSRNTKTEMPNP